MSRRSIRNFVTVWKVSVFGVILVRNAECGKMRTRITPDTDTFYEVCQNILSAKPISGLSDEYLGQRKIKNKENLRPCYSSTDDHLYTHAFIGQKYNIVNWEKIRGFIQGRKPCFRSNREKLQHYYWYLFPKWVY